MTDNTQTPPTETPEDKAFAALDTSKLKQELTPDIEKIVEDRVSKTRDQDREEIKRDLAKRLSGEDPDPKWRWRGKDSKGRPAPEDWDEPMEKAEELIDKKLEEKFKQNEQRQKQQQELQTKQSQEQRKQLVARWDDQVYALQAAGVVPSYSKEVQEKIDKGTMLSQEDWQKDEGLKARAELFRISVDKGINPTQSYKRVWSKQPAGARAPVFGGSGAVAPKEDEYSLEDTAKLAGKPLSA